VNPTASVSGFDTTREVFLARAPGRLDLMGGVSDYSGGLCLEWPTREATFCALQLNDSGSLVVQSANAGRENWQPRFEVPLSQLLEMSLQQAREFFAQESSTRWASYILGALPILRDAGYLTARRLEILRGATLWISSDVPSGAGVSSSASVEVAAMQAFCAALEISLDGIETARLCQRVENAIAGAPCGIMDQMTVTLGQKDQLLQLLCQPHKVLPPVSLPQGVEIWGLDSHVKHSVGGTSYGRARCGAFMGRRILRDLLPREMRGASGELYLANIAPDIWRSVRELLPDQMHGSDFLARYDDHGDQATHIEADFEYSIRLATEHPIYERARVERFIAFLEAAKENPVSRFPLLCAAGDLMIQSHFSYEHRCNLGSSETDFLVQLCRAAGTQSGVLGAKITGGGAGGTAAILCDRSRNLQIETVLRDIAEKYERHSGKTPHLFGGSSQGARKWGVRRTSVDNLEELLNQPRTNQPRA